MIPTRDIVDPMFGEPILRAENNGEVAWTRGNSVSQLQKGAGGVSANLYGGSQTGDDWAAIFIPVCRQLFLKDFTGKTQWSYYLTNAESMGVNIVIWVHDPNDWSKRAEITQIAGVDGLGKAAGWNTHKLDTSTTQFAYYGESCTASGLTSGTQYTLAQFQADVMFKGWTIYRISLEYGWEASGTFEDAWVSEVEISGQHIHLYLNPRDDFGSATKTLTQLTTGTSTTKATMISPRATKRVRIISVALENLGSTSTGIEIYFHTGANIDAAVAKAIWHGMADKDYSSSSQAWAAKEGPLGGIGEVVSIRTVVDITTNGRVTISYREE